MPTRIQTQFTKALSKNIFCMGDSHTKQYGQTYYPDQMWGALLQKKLTGLGATARVHNWGQSGNKTDNVSPNMLYRMPLITSNPLIYPDLTLIEGGVNDYIGILSTLTSSGTVATATFSGAHGLATGQVISVYGADQAGYNVTNTPVTVTGTTTLTYPVVSGLATPATSAGGAIRVCLQTQANLQALIRWAKFGCVGLVAGQANLPAGGAPGNRYIVQADTSTNGGMIAGTGQTATITGAGGGAMTVWEYRNGEAAETGWGRIATATTAADKCSRVLVLGVHYMNLAANAGDNYNTVANTGTQYAKYDEGQPYGIRAQQKAAVLAEQTNNPGVVYCDLFRLMGNRIWGASPTDTQGSGSWHYTTSNEHCNTYGYELYAEYICQTIEAQTGWIAALTL